MLLLLRASSALSVLVSAPAQSGGTADSMQDIHRTFRLQAHLRERSTLEDSSTEVRPLLHDYMVHHCQNTSATYDSLLDHNLHFWKQIGLDGLDNHTSESANILCIVNNTICMERGAKRGGLLPSYFSLLKSLTLKMVLPDLALPFNSGGKPSQLVNQRGGGNRKLCCHSAQHRRIWTPCFPVC